MDRRSCAGQREAAALISQSRRFHRRVKGLLYDGFFLLPSSGRMLFNIQDPEIQNTFAVPSVTSKVQSIDSSLPASRFMEVPPNKYSVSEKSS